MENTSGATKRLIVVDGLKQMKEVVKLSFYSKLSGRKPTSMWFWSLPGVGKSSTIQKLGEELTEELRQKGDDRKVIVRVIQANHLNEGDLGGMAAPSKRKNKKTGEEESIIKKLRVEGTLPEMDDDEYNSPGIMFFDELGEARTEVRTEILSFCDGIKREDGYTMPPNWIVVAASNTEEGGGLEIYGDFQFSVVARFAHFFLKPNLNEWLQWAESVENEFTKKPEGLHPIVVSFVRQYGLSALYDDEQTFQDKMTKFRTGNSPRKWHEISSILYTSEACQYHDFSTEEGTIALYQYINSQLGPEMGDGRFLPFLKNASKIIDASDIIKKNASKDKELKNKLLNEDLSIRFLSFEMAIRNFVKQVQDAR